LAIIPRSGSWVSVPYHPLTIEYHVVNGVAGSSRLGYGPQFGRASRYIPGTLNQMSEFSGVNWIRVPCTHRSAHVTPLSGEICTPIGVSTAGSRKFAATSAIGTVVTQNGHDTPSYPPTLVTTTPFTSTTGSNSLALPTL
jgi:hypothetical protein